MVTKGKTNAWGTHDDIRRSDSIAVLLLWLGTYDNDTSFSHPLPSTWFQYTSAAQPLWTFTSSVATTVSLWIWTWVNLYLFKNIFPGKVFPPGWVYSSFSRWVNLFLFKRNCFLFKKSKTTETNRMKTIFLHHFCSWVRDPMRMGWGKICIKDMSREA